MRSLLLFFSIIIVYGASAQHNGNDTAKPLSMDSLFRKKAMESEGKPFPDFTAEIDGRRLTLDSLKGKVVFINFWFEACPPCIAELHALNGLYQKFSGYRDFEFLSITYETPGSIQAFRKKYNVLYKIASVSIQECYRLNQNNGFPTSIILDKEGTIRHLYTGGSDDKTEAEKLVYDTIYRHLLNELQR